MNDALIKKAYLLGRFDTLCEAGLRFKSAQDRQAASAHFVKTGELKLAHLHVKTAQQLMSPDMMGQGMPPMNMQQLSMPQMGGMGGGMDMSQMGGMPMGGGMDMGMQPPTTQQGNSPAPMPPDGSIQPQPQPSQGEVLLLGGQVSNSDIKGFEKILNILKGLKMQYDEQQGMAANAGSQQSAAGGAPPPM